MSDPTVIILSDVTVSCYFCLDIFEMFDKIPLQDEYELDYINIYKKKKRIGIFLNSTQPQNFFYMKNLLKKIVLFV